MSATEMPVVNTVTVRRWYPIIGLLVALSLLGLSIYHWGQLGIPIWRIPVIAVSFVWLVITIGAAHFSRPKRSNEASRLKASVVIPSRNEDPEMLRALLRSLDRQTVLPYEVYFIENGETNGVAERIFREWAERTPIGRTFFHYREQAGKREAQALAFAQDTEADVFATVDSDTELDPYAIEEGLKPFSDRKVTSVAGLLIAKNRDKSLLTRVVDLGFVSSFMNGRAAWSTFNSVAVNCGGLAFYRVWVVRQYLDEYLTQTVLGQKASSGDDRVLTCLSALEGKTVFQETSVGHTLMPENFSHLRRQRVRWWRSFWWGGVWLLRRFSPRRTIWWLVLSQYITFTLYAVMFPLILFVDPIVNQKFPWVFFVYVAGLSYIRTARTLKVNRPDQSTARQLASFILLSPLVTFLNLWLCTILQWWGLFTFGKMEWGTRQKVEVGI